MFNLNHLYYFYVTASEHSVTNAAKRLHISQPSLSTQLKAFEFSLGCALFNRNGRNLELNREGQYLFRQCQPIFASADQLYSNLVNRKSRSATSLRLGASEAVSNPFILQAARSLIAEREAAAQPHLTLTSKPLNALISGLKAGHFDAVVAEQWIRDSDVSRMATLPLPVMLACPATLTKRCDGCACGKSIGIDCVLEKLIRLNWIMPAAGTKLRSETDLFLSQAGITPRVAVESETMSSLVDAVANGLGISLLPRHYLREQIAESKVSIVGPGNGFWLYELHLMARPDWDQRALLPELHAAFLSTLNSFPSGILDRCPQQGVEQIRRSRSIA